MANNYKLNGAIDNIKEGICSTCGKKSESTCDRCGDFYCSIDCQKKDWPQHRYICFPMPNLVKAGQQPSLKNDTPCQASQTELAAKDTTPPKQIRLQNGCCVVLTGFKSSNRCYVRSTNPSTVAELDKVLNEINEFGKQSSLLSVNPKNNSYALTLRNDKWCRVQILGNSTENSYRVSFIDSGDISKRSLKDLRKIPPSLINLPNFLRLVQLRNVKPFTQKHILDSLIPYINKEYRIDFLKMDKSGANVELHKWGSSILLNSLIQELCSNVKDKGNDVDHLSVASSSSIKDIRGGHSDNKCNNKNVSNDCKGQTPTNLDKNTKEEKSVRKPSNLNINGECGNGVHATENSNNKMKPFAPRQIQMEKPCLEPPFETIVLNENDHNSKIMIMDNSYIDSGYIGCLLDKYCENLKDISKFLKEYNIADDAYKPKFKEYCLANFEQEWYRARVVEVLSDDKFLVVYIDFTNEMELSSKSIRRYPMSLNMPCCTTLCALDGLPEKMSDKLKQFLDENCVPFNALSIDSIRINDDIRYVKSNELLNKLRDLKLL